jgi:hypothetical protein
MDTGHHYVMTITFGLLWGVAGLVVTTTTGDASFAGAAYVGLSSAGVAIVEKLWDKKIRDRERITDDLQRAVRG